jgi:hypothetical protein
VGLVSRVIEAAGVATVTLEMIWTYHNAVGIPRVAAIEHPFGRPYGDVGDVTRQRDVLLAALELGPDAREPGTVKHLPFRWPQSVEDTHWHPAEPSPIIALMKARRAKRDAT